eukprot:CAMPEP_0194282024 /NCGR_PEP_ID=MMETSP0169-20130528/22183_1 /TAXON_ID=218684 /ORGANISM="Corethron pennatum, Strain L29A3" /LENGTH=347 /DNA_ID=CAMNT_0039027235 /DNA_START=44 /DNA_END=1087 /DNA_ORIENTATION=-
MFGSLGKQFADQIGQKVEQATGQYLATKNGGGTATTEQATEILGKIHGKRKALFIGINYTGQQGELRGCINDVKNIKAFLLENFPIGETLTLTDDGEGDKLPTRDNLLAAFKWLRRGAQSGDSLIMHYSGHGGSVKDEDGDEEDGYDETLIPLDYATAGHIVDDEVHDVLVRGLPKGVRLTAIMDCCHSETVLDLPFSYNINGDLEIIENNKNEGISKILSSGVQFLFDGNKKRVQQSFMEGFKLLMSAGKGGDSAAREKTIQTRSTEADVISFSGCKDSQTSADANIEGEATGAMSYALIKSLKNDTRMDYTDLLKSMRQTLEGKYTQVPMLSAGRKLDLTSPFQI